MRSTLATRICIGFLVIFIIAGGLLVPGNQQPEIWQASRELAVNPASPHLNKDAESNIPFSVSQNASQHNTQSVRSSYYLPASLTPANHTLVISRGETAVKTATQHTSFIPLFRLLLYPKHWFW